LVTMKVAGYRRVVNPLPLGLALAVAALLALSVPPATAEEPGPGGVLVVVSAPDSPPAKFVITAAHCIQGLNWTPGEECERFGDTARQGSEWLEVPDDGGDGEITVIKDGVFLVNCYPPNRCSPPRR
jgi:hypothetical protein